MCEDQLVKVNSFFKNFKEFINLKLGMANRPDLKPNIGK